MLNLQQTRYKNGEKHLSAFGMSNQLKPLKNDGEHGWLYDVSNSSLQVICSDLSEAYNRFFKKLSGYPRFKSRKKSEPKYPLRCDGVYFNDNVAIITKLGKVAYKTSYYIPEGKGYKFTNPRIKYIGGKWILSFGMECENQATTLTDKSMGMVLFATNIAAHFLY